MKSKLFTVILLLLLCVVGVGFYRGWFALSSTRPDDGKININLTVDPDKVKEDAESVKDKTMELTGQPTKGVKEN